MLFNILLENPLFFLIIASALILSLSVHEFAHAYIADRLGDTTARYFGRVTLNPLAHLDPIGTLLLFIAGFGWGRPVPFDPTLLKYPKRDIALIAFAGPGSNFLLAILAAIIYKIAPIISYNPIGESFLYLIVYYNLILGFFNLIPIHPLDGFKVVNGLLPYNLSYQWMQLAPYGVYFLLVLVLTHSIDTLTQPLITFGLKILGL